MKLKPNDALQRIREAHKRWSHARWACMTGETTGDSLDPHEYDAMADSVLGAVYGSSRTINTWLVVRVFVDVLAAIIAHGTKDRPIDDIDDIAMEIGRSLAIEARLHRNRKQPN